MAIEIQDNGERLGERSLGNGYAIRIITFCDILTHLNLACGADVSLENCPRVLRVSYAGSLVNNGLVGPYSATVLVTLPSAPDHRPPRLASAR
ncbi:hypothetical protein TNCV_4937151 [Trichonephila clavipes]|nr:hypothetical protein TNCV_4937151 [Trichonephila clavipes]